MRPVRGRRLVDRFLAAYWVSGRRVCGVLGVPRSVYHHRPIADDQTPLRMRIREIAAVLIRYGYKRIHSLVRREG